MLERGGWSTLRPSRFTSDNLTQWPLYRWLTGAPGSVWKDRKISITLGIDPRTFQPVVSRYTDWAVLVHVSPVFQFTLTTCFSYYLCVLYSAVQCYTVQYSAVQCYTVQYSAVQCYTVQYSAVQCYTVQCSAKKPSHITAVFFCVFKMWEENVLLEDHFLPAFCDLTSVTKSFRQIWMKFSVRVLYRTVWGKRDICDSRLMDMICSWRQGISTGNSNIYGHLCVNFDTYPQRNAIDHLWVS
jgi:hypothetical protein